LLPYSTVYVLRLTAHLTNNMDKGCWHHQSYSQSTPRQHLHNWQSPCILALELKSLAWNRKSIVYGLRHQYHL
jgi:hypothetical protein